MVVTAPSSGADPHAAMFIRDFIHVDQPFEVVAPRFVSDTAWVSEGRRRKTERGRAGIP